MTRRGRSRKTLALLEDRLAEYLRTHTSARIDDLVRYVLGLLARGLLSPEDATWVRKQQRVGLEEGLDHRLRDASWRPDGFPARRFVAYLDEADQHRWTALEEALHRRDPAELGRINAHAWSVIREAIGQVQSQAKVAMLTGDSWEKVHRLVTEELEARLDAIRPAEPAA